MVYPTVLLVRFILPTRANSTQQAVARVCGEEQRTCHTLETTQAVWRERQTACGTKEPHASDMRPKLAKRIGVAVLPQPDTDAV